jgi:hypothetical protein
MLDTIIPQIQKLLSTNAVSNIKGQATNIAFKKIYSLMPIAVRLIVKEETFVHFCEKHKHKIFGVVESSAAKRPIKKLAAKKILKKAIAKKAVKKAVKRNSK